jgi:hypothetical protein
MPFEVLCEECNRKSAAFIYHNRHLCESCADRGDRSADCCEFCGDELDFRGCCHRPGCVIREFSRNNY